MKTIMTILALVSFQAFASDPVGSYDKGSLVDGVCLDSEGEGYMQLYRDVGNIWGTSELVGLIKNTAADMQKRFPGRDRLQVEEMSAENGGEVDGHGSHENGLDVDLSYFKTDGVEHDPRATHKYYADPMVQGGAVSPNFDVERNWELLKSLHRNGKVARIFMDQTLKNKMCQYARSSGEYSANINVLRSIRHVTNHQDHMHVRLSCPATARRCQNQAPVPAGSGCP